jgi:hypothetical protein
MGHMKVTELGMKLRHSDTTFYDGRKWYYSDCVKHYLYINYQLDALIIIYS